VTGTVVIADCDHGSVDIEQEVFRAAGLDTRVARCRTAEDVVAAGRGALALVTQYAPVTRTVLEELPSLRAVARYGTGVDTIDVAAASERHIHVLSVPDYAVSEVSDQTIALILALTRGVVAADRAVRSGRWDLEAVRDVRRTSVLRLGLVGVGRIGALVARKAAALGFDVVAYDEKEVPEGIGPAGFDDLLATSDVISLHLPLTARTRHLMGAAEFARMRPGSFLINTARGPIVDEPALAEALRSGHLGGAGLDVVESEPLAADSPLRDCPNVVITPHVGFYSRQALHELKHRVATGVVDALRTAGVIGPEPAGPPEPTESTEPAESTESTEPA
jgi:D-3-phosphoglycerate dehydrogenase